MKFLSDYLEEKSTEIHNKYGAFYAFSTSQFDAAKVEGVKYTNCQGGLICPTEHTGKLITELMDNYDNGVKQDIAENGIDKIIERELYNHEAFYTGDTEATFDCLELYEGVTPEKVREIYRKVINSPEHKENYRD